MIATCGGHVFFPKLLRSIIQKYVVQNLLMKDQRLLEEVQAQEELEKTRGWYLLFSSILLQMVVFKSFFCSILILDLSDPLLSYEFCSEEIKCKIEGIKLMVRWLYGLKLNTLIGKLN